MGLAGAGRAEEHDILLGVQEVEVVREGPAWLEVRLQVPDAVLMPTQAEIAVVADQLEHVIATAPPQQAKVLLRILIAELRVNGKADIHPTYRVTIPDTDPPLGRGSPTGRSGDGGSRTRATFPPCRAACAIEAADQQV